MEEFNIYTLEDLYNRLFPAFNTKRCELNLRKLDIREQDMWNYLKINVWKDRKNLTLYDMVSDIFDMDTYDALRFIWKTL